MALEQSPSSSNTLWTESEKIQRTAVPSMLSVATVIEWLRWAAHVPRRIVVLRPTAPKELQTRPTAWLDGLRGFAAFLVYFHHNLLWTHNTGAKSRWFESAYGYEGEYYFVALPYVRTWFNGGHYAVATFFVISGYVLSTSSMRLIHSGDYEKLAQSLSSALFRRWFRLFLPTLGTTFCWMITWHLFGWWCVPFTPEPNLWKEWVRWYNDAKNFAFLYNTVGFPWLYYNIHTWTIPHEFKGSLVIFTVLLALSTCTRNYRLSLTAGLIFYTMYIVDGWFVAMFLAGMLLCELDMLASKEELPSFFTKFERYKKPIFIGMFIVSGWLGGVPQANNNLDDLKKSPGWSYTAYLVPSATSQHKWFFLFWAALFLVASVPRLPWIKAFFNSSFCQYLGRISFSLYLMHGPVIWTLGQATYLFVGWGKDEPDYPYPSYYNKFPITKAGPLGMAPAFWLPQIVLIPFTFWVSNIVTVLIDEPSVKFAHWLRNKTMPSRGMTTIEMEGLIK